VTEACVAVGSNIEPERSIAGALVLLRAKVDLRALSTFYRTAPLGSPGAPPFINGAARIETDLSARELKLGVLRGIEEALGRVRGSDRNAPRTIDLDLIWFGGQVIAEPDLVIPDPEILTRAFIALPLAELMPGLVLPGGVPLEEIAEALPLGDMTPLEALTKRLREESHHEPEKG
jgi:2-amino-4-hydroxy-6-hydroxymethyldihydropteridine diphosphokinase